MEDRQRLERALEEYGFKAKEWRTNEDGVLEVVVEGLFTVTEESENEDRGLYESAEGELIACVVGAGQYNNQRVLWGLHEEDMDPDASNEVDDPSLLDIT